MTAFINIKGRTTPGRPSAPKFTISAIFTVWKERRALARLDEKRLRDLGISPIDATKEAARPFWDLPRFPR